VPSKSSRPTPSSGRSRALPDRHITDEEVWNASGHKPRIPTGAPVATCLRCGQEYVSFYTQQACDCWVDLSRRERYDTWLILFQRMGYGVLTDPSSRKFPRFDKVIGGRQMLTLFLQSDILVAKDMVSLPYARHYDGPEWSTLGFVLPPDDLVRPTYPSLT
jgi:hypothetical protein